MGATAKQVTNEKRFPAASLVFACLLAALLVSAQSVVSVAHKAREQVGLLERLQRINAAHQAQASRLQLEYSTLAEFGRVEDLAAKQLGMHRAQSARMVVAP